MLRLNKNVSTNSHKNTNRWIETCIIRFLKAVVQTKIQTFRSYCAGYASEWSFRWRRRMSQHPALTEMWKNCSFASDSLRLTEFQHCSSCVEWFPKFLWGFCRQEGLPMQVEILQLCILSCHDVFFYSLKASWCLPKFNLPFLPHKQELYKLFEKHFNCLS